VRVSGFTFVRNGTLLGYPFVESIRSILPIVDEFVVNVGRSEDDTLDRVRQIGDPKIRIVESVWNEGMRDQGFVYGQQKMIAHFNCTGDWAFYLEGDEVVHEQDLPTIRRAMEQYLDDSDIEALAFDYHHFYGTPGQVVNSPRWCRQAVRIVRNTIRVTSPGGLFVTVLDRYRKGRYPRAARVGVPIYHYGHCRSVTQMKEKMRHVSRYWGEDPPAFGDYGRIDPTVLHRFEGVHPAVMEHWLAEVAEQDFVPDPSYRPTRKERKHRWMLRVERTFGLELSMKRFRLVK